MLKSLVKAISTYEDRRKAKTCAKLDAITKEMGYSLADLIGAEVTPVRLPRRNTVTQKIRASPGPAGDASRSSF